MPGAVFRLMSEHPDVSVTVIGEFGYFNQYKYVNISVYQRLDHASQMFILSTTYVVLLPRPIRRMLDSIPLSILSRLRRMGYRLSQTHPRRSKV